MKLFSEHAKQLYKLDAAIKFVISENRASDHSSKLALKISDFIESNATNVAILVLL